MLELRDVTKVFTTGTFGGKAVTAVSGVSFDIQPGEIVSLIRESGSGKTTVGKMILRLTPVTDGAIAFGGRDVSSFGRRELRDYYGRVQGVFQDPFSSYNPVFKVDRVFEMIRRVYLPGLTGAEWGKRRQRALEDVGLEPRDILGKFSMLDASTRIDVLNILADLKERGLGVLFVTHDLALGNYISDRVVILQRGRIVEMGPTPKVFSNPVHPYTRMLLACVPQLTSKWEETPRNFDEAAAPVTLQLVDDDHYVER